MLTQKFRIPWLLLLPLIALVFFVASALALRSTAGSWGRIPEVIREASQRSASVRTLYESLKNDSLASRVRVQAHLPPRATKWILEIEFTNPTFVDMQRTDDVAMRNAALTVARRAFNALTKPPLYSKIAVILRTDGAQMSRPHKRISINFDISASGVSPD